MKSLVAVCALLTGCAATTYAPIRDWSPLEMAKAECEFEATKATANIRNGFEAGYMKGTITRQCMITKGYLQQ
jgi:hypothetical protein